MWIQQLEAKGTGAKRSDYKNIVIVVQNEATIKSEGKNDNKNISIYHSNHILTKNNPTTNHYKTSNKSLIRRRRKN